MQRLQRKPRRYIFTMGVTALIIGALGIFQLITHSVAAPWTSYALIAVSLFWIIMLGREWMRIQHDR